MKATNIRKDKVAQQVYDDVLFHHGDQPGPFISWLMNSFLRTVAEIRRQPELRK